MRKPQLTRQEKMCVIENLIGLIQDNYPVRDRLTSPEYFVTDYDALSDEDLDYEFEAASRFIDLEVIPYLTAYYLKIKKEEI